MTEPDLNTNPRARVPAKVVLVSIVGVWAVYFVLVTVRSALFDDHWLGEMIWRRGLITGSAILITIVVWQLVRLLDGRKLALRIAATMLLALPAAMAIAAINNAIFRPMDSDWTLDDGRARIVMGKDGTIIIDTPGAPRFVMKNPEEDSAKSLWKGLSDIALGRYFLLLAWGALFLALGNAEEVRAAERRAAAFRRAAKAAELRSLRYQVNPHFLFNTLNSLSALVMTGRKEVAETMIQTLSDFYRTSLTGDPTVDVRLSEEVGFQQLYLAIEAVRFPDRLRVTVDVPEDLQDVCVPGLILQPLVENAVKHGVAATGGVVTISIVARQLGDRLAITVANDGRAELAPPNGTGIGLANVRDRLSARYGDEAEAEIARPMAGGFEVTLHLPLILDGC